MAKESERRTARILFVEQKKTAKEVSQLVGVTEKTIGTWITKYKWKEARNAAIAAKENQLSNLYQIVDDLVADRIKLSKELKSCNDGDRQREIRENIAGIDNTINRYNKQIELRNKNNTVTLGVYLSVMKGIFDALQRYNIELYLKTLDFQEHHIQEQSTILD